MNAFDMVRAALARTGKTQTELAEYMGWSKQNLSGRLKNNSLTFDELAKALDFCGYSVRMEDATGVKLPALNNSASPRVTQMVDGVVYDTSKAESLCSSKGEHPTDLYMELFRDASSAYFIAYYQLWEGGHNQLSPVTSEAARKFWARFSGKPVSEFE